MGPVHTGTGPKGKKVTTPKRKCTHCGEESETFEQSCPNCGKPYGLSRKATIGIIAAATVAAVLVLGGCAAFFVGIVDELDSSTISREEFNAVELGSSRAEVERELGEPATVGEFEDGAECIYYDEEGRTEFDVYPLELCFFGGTLEAKFREPD